MKNRRFIINLILLAAISISFSVSIAAQSEDQILVAGNPPFTHEDFESVVKYYERGLDFRFSQDERDEFRSKIVAAWRKYQKSNGQNLTNFMQMVRRLNAGVSDDKIKSRQQEFADALLADLKTMSGNGWSPFIVSLYQKAHPGTNAELSNQAEIQAENKTTADRTSGEPNFRPFEGVVGTADLVGKWGKGSASTSGYMNTVTKEYKGAYGAANQHDIYANGSFDYTNYAQVSLYGCTTELFTSMKGRFSVSGSEVTFNYVSGNVRGKDSCKATGFDKPAQIKPAKYRLERDGGRLRLCEIGADLPNCLYKEEK